MSGGYEAATGRALQGFARCRVASNMARWSEGQSHYPYMSAVMLAYHPLA